MSYLKSKTQKKLHRWNITLLMFILALIPIGSALGAPFQSQTPTTEPVNQKARFYFGNLQNQDTPPTEELLSDRNLVSFIDAKQGGLAAFPHSSSSVSDVETILYDDIESNPWPYFNVPWSIYYGEKERYWDDVSYNYNDLYGGNWSVWPAAGGSGGKIPEPGDDKYPSNTDSWMIYGPFTFKGSQQALWGFYIWREIAQGDHLFFGYSTNGINFRGWSLEDSDTFWRLGTIDMNALINEPNLWIGWHFVSDGSGSARGPYIDDIFLQREVATSPNGSRVTIPMATFSKYIPPNNPDPCTSYEPNDGLSTAKPLGRSGSTLRSTSCSGDSNDFYYFNVAGSGTVQITPNLPSSLYKEATISLLRDGKDTPNGCYKAPPVQGRSGTPQPITASCSVSPGKYYVWLYNIGTGRANDVYTLQVLYT